MGNASCLRSTRLDFGFACTFIMGDEDRVKGMGEAAEQAQKGLALFEKEAVETTIDKDAAAAFKTEHEAAIKVKADPKYVDACKIAKDLPPPNGNFALTNAPAKAAEEAKEEVKEEKKDEKKKDDN